MNKFLLVDFIEGNGYFAYAERLDKIEGNLNRISYLKTNVENTKKTKTTAFFVMGVVGRWIVIYGNNGIDENGTMMYFLDYRLDVDNYAPLSKIFSTNNSNAIKKLQQDHKNDFLPNMDILELANAEPWEMIIKRNFFACDNDSKVLEKAKKLDVLPAIKNLKPGETVKVIIVDERIVNEVETTLNIYAIIHFGGHAGKNEKENGFSYLKLNNFQNQKGELKDFEDAIMNAGGKFDRSFFMERFGPEKLN